MYRCVKYGPKCSHNEKYIYFMCIIVEIHFSKMRNLLLYIIIGEIITIKKYNYLLNLNCITKY